MSRKATESLVAALEPDVRRIAKQLLRSQPSRVDELTQVGMEVVCEKAPLHIGLTPQDIFQRVFTSVRGAMIDSLAKESREQKLKAALFVATASVVDEVELGNILASVPERDAHRRRTTDALVASAVMTLVPLFTRAEDPALAAEAHADQARLHDALAQELPTIPAEQRQVVEAVFFEGLDYEQAAARFGISKATAWRRVQGALVELGKRLGAVR